MLVWVSKQIDIGVLVRYLHVPSTGSLYWMSGVPRMRPEELFHVWLFPKPFRDVYVTTGDVMTSYKKKVKSI